MVPDSNMQRRVTYGTSRKVRIACDITVKVSSVENEYYHAIRKRLDQKIKTFNSLDKLFFRIVCSED